MASEFLTGEIILAVQGVVQTMSASGCQGDVQSTSKMLSKMLVLFRVWSKNTAVQEVGSVLFLFKFEFGGGQGGN